MKRTAILGLIATLALAAWLTADDKKANVLLQAALAKETVQGDLKGAIQLYGNALKEAGTNRALAARALLQMAECYQKLGDSESRKIYEQVVREYADQKEAVTVARARLGASAALSDTFAKRLVCTDCGDSDIGADGRLMVFTDWDSGDLAIRDLSSGQVRRLMAKPGSFKDSRAYIEEAVLSPDLRQVAYNWDPDDGPGHRHQVRVISNEPGGKWRVLLDNPGDEYYKPTAWSADGKSILVLVEKADSTWQLTWVSAADGTMRPLKSLQWRFQATYLGHSAPRVSPDGRYVAYSALAVNPTKFPPAPTDSQDQHIYVLAADGSSETEVVKTAGLNWNPVWTPDGKHLLFLSNRAGTRGLWSIAIENGKATAAPSLVSSNLGSGSVWPIGMTRSGSYHYAQWQGDVEQISIADVRGGKSAETFVGLNPAWSPDGSTIAFKRHHPGSEDAYDLVVHSLESGEEKTLPSTHGFTGPGQPAWLRDGKGILTGLTHTNGAFLGFQRVDLESGEWKQIPVATAALSRDDKMRYMFRPGGIAAVDLATGTERQILAAPKGEKFGLENANALVLSPDSRTLAFWRENVQTAKIHLTTVGVDGAKLRELHTVNLDTKIGHLVWTKDGRAILFAQGQGDKWQIMRIPAEGGGPEFTGIEAVGKMGSFDLSPDGSHIVYSSRKRQKDEVWALDNVLAAVK